MTDNENTQSSCYHCGGVLTSSGDESLSCLMCAREMGHLCENCANAPVAEPEIIEKKPRKKRTKKAGSTR